MGGTMNTVKKTVVKEVTQFQITSDLLRNLYKFNLTPVTKLVLLELTTHLNEAKNGSVVFPSVGYIAEVLGIGLTAAKKAINDLIKEGLIIKSKRDKVSGNHNKYLLTPKVQNTAYKQSENELFKQSENDLFMITNNKEQKKEQRDKNISGGNVSEEDAILANYAVKHGARNVKAYINTLKSTGSAKKIIKEHKKEFLIIQRRIDEYKEQQAMFAQWKKDAQNASSYKNDKAWFELGKKFGFKK